MTAIDTILAALDSTEKAVMRTAKAILSNLTPQHHQHATGLSGKFILKCYTRDEVKAEQLVEHYQKVFTETYNGMLTRLGMPLTLHAESDLAQVLEELHCQMLTIFSGQDPYTEILHPLDYVLQRPDAALAPPGVCFFIPTVGHMHSSKETVVSMRIAFHKQDESQRYQPYGISRTILSGRHYGKDGAFVRRDQS